MQWLYTFLLTVLSLTATLAAPSSPKIRKGRSFKVDRFEDPNHIRSGSAAVRKAFTKYGWTVPEQLEQQAAKAVAASSKKTSDRIRVAAESRFIPAETQFLAPVTIGGTTFAMNIDTGSSDLWVFSSELPPKSINGHSVFDPAKSKTFKPLDDLSFSITYGDQSSASGIVGQDTVNIGGAKVENQAVELATRVSGSFTRDSNADGLLGLGFGVNNQVKPKRQKTFFENVMASLEQPLFTATLKRGVMGSYEFGVVDRAKFQGELAHVPVDPSQGWWQFTSPGARIGEQDVDTRGTPSIVDTGTSILLMQDDVVQTYYQQVQGARLDQEQRGFVFPCASKLPDLDIVISDSYTATVAGELMSFNKLDEETCFGALQSSEGQPVQILGDTFLNSQFVVFDGGNMRLGFAPHK